MCDHAVARGLLPTGPANTITDVEAAEEAVLDALCAGRDLRGCDGQGLRRFPAERFALA